MTRPPDYDLRVPVTELKTQAVAEAFSMAWRRAGVGGRDPDASGQDAAMAWDRLAAFRGELHGCFTVRADALFELADAVLCAERW
jgi:hypothetical protein